MFSYVSSSPCEIQGTITFTKFPRLGPNIDSDGDRWNIYAISGDTVNAVREESLHNYYTDTSGNDGQYFDVGTAGTGVVSQSWKPYKFEVMEQS